MQAINGNLIEIITVSDRRVVDWNAADLTAEDEDHILDMWAAGNPAYIGEVEYRAVTSAAPAPLSAGLSATVLP